jgi:hypothetical protein
MAVHYQNQVNLSASWQDAGAIIMVRKFFSFFSSKIIFYKINKKLNLCAGSIGYLADPTIGKPNGSCNDR